MYNQIDPWKTLGPLSLAGALALAGCLETGGMMDTTSVQLTTGTGGSTGEGDDTSTSLPPIMTTTVDPNETTGTTDDASTGSTGMEKPPQCGDGVVQDPEECDDGENNADDAACTEFCAKATCGDGLVHKGAEQCDDGAANGTYNSCNATCTDLGPRCGDGVVQADQDEQCDSDDPHDGCLKGSCQKAASCLELKNAWQNDINAQSGLYSIFHNDAERTVFCDMDTDGGGYTFLKYATPGGLEIPAKDAEAECQKLGMHLFVPRTQVHLAKAVEVAGYAGLSPIGGGTDGDVTTYLRIMGIYPEVEGQSCPGKPLNSMECPQWQAHDLQRYWVTGAPISPNQPGVSNCKDCSMFYTWEGSTLKMIEAVYLGGFGAKSPAFLCDTADKTMP